MSCCATGTGLAPEPALQGRDAELAEMVRHPREGSSFLQLAVPAMHCGGCVAKIEREIGRLPGVANVRANLGARRVALEWRGAAARAGELARAIEELGFDVHPVDPDAEADGEKRAMRDLLMRLAVAAFAAMNIMLLSVSVWSGAEDATRDLMHLISAVIAVPAVAVAGRPFFASALSVLAHRRLNMDVPISLAVLLALGASLYEALTGGVEAYFDAAVMLLALLLVGRVLERTMRARARDAVGRLARLAPRGAQVVGADGADRWVPLAEIGPGDVVRVAAGERVPTDGVVTTGASALDRSLVTGESVAERVGAGDAVEAGVLNLSAPLELRVTAAAEDSSLATIARLIEAAEQRRGRMMRLADAAARIYAPAVHLVGLVTFLAWLALGAGWHAALWTAISVLVITCPCALGLAAPMAQVVASGVLFRRGVMLKGGDALERLAVADHAVLDKTGTLTLGRPVLAGEVTDDDLALAAGLARTSRHPLSAAVVAAARARGLRAQPVGVVEEFPGCGLIGRHGGAEVRLGAADWLGVGDDGPGGDGSGGAGAGSDGQEVWLETGGRHVRLSFEDGLRPGAKELGAALAAEGIRSEIVSGDRAPAVRALAGTLGIADWTARVTPEAKIARVDALRGEGRKVLMVGDGLNDAAALAAAHVSMAPASAADAGRAAADLVFFGESLDAVPLARRVARAARRVTLQNFALAGIYNLIAIPIAVTGNAGPLAAAIAMSLSSLVVVGNALRLNLVAPAPEGPREAAPGMRGAEAVTA